MLYDMRIHRRIMINSSETDSAAVCRLFLFFLFVSVERIEFLKLQLVKIKF